MTTVMRSATRAALLAIIGGAVSACAGHRPALSASAGTPQVGWVIMHGDSDNPDAEFSCQSNPSSECVIPVSRPGGQNTFSDVHVYFHPGLSPTKYSGTVNIGFLGNTPGGHEIKPLITVAPGDVGNSSVVGIVTDKPGTHMLSINIAAESRSGTNQIRQQIPVIVR